MTGESRRFYDASHQQPKFTLSLAGGFVFDRAVRSFSRCFSDDAFLFALRDDAIAKEFVTARCKVPGITRISTSSEIIARLERNA